MQKVAAELLGGQLFAIGEYELSSELDISVEFNGDVLRREDHAMDHVGL